jgi:hypothetical protein
MRVVPQRDRAILFGVMPGLDPGIHLVSGTMDQRIKSAGDDFSIETSVR